MKKNVLFFAGRDMPLKRYTSYFSSSLNLIQPSGDWKQEEDSEEICILTHFIGILHALLFCDSKSIIPRIIVCMDSISLQVMGNDYCNENQLSIYAEFKQRHIDVSKYNIQVLRQEFKRGLNDVEYSNQIIFYPERDHHPYRIKRIRDTVVKLLDL
jgi:hypothetical protein